MYTYEVWIKAGTICDFYINECGRKAADGSRVVNAVVGPFHNRATLQKIADRMNAGAHTVASARIELARISAN